MASSSGSRGSGATEHTDTIAFYNVGLAGKAFTGKAWGQHRKKLLPIFTHLLSEPALGLFLNEVGNLSDLLTPKGQQRLQDVLQEAFQNAGAIEHGPPQFLWSEGETMAALRAEVQVVALEPLTKIKRVDPWRVVERFELIRPTEHGQYSMLIYNTHQPSSKLRPFKLTQKIDFCKAVLRDAIRYHSNHEENVGYGFGGDANCTMANWVAAHHETAERRLTFGQPTYMQGLNKKTRRLHVRCRQRGLELRREHLRDTGPRETTRAHVHEVVLQSTLAEQEVVAPKL